MLADKDRIFFFVIPGLSGDLKLRQDSLCGSGSRSKCGMTAEDKNASR